jgi:hypothetical protein
MRQLAQTYQTLSSKLARAAVRAVLLVLLFAIPVLAQNSQSPTDPNDAPVRALRVARISLLEGDVNYQRGGDKQTTGQNNNQADWFDATINTALEERDQLYSGRRGRAELQLNGRTLVRIDRETNLRITQFNTGTVQLAQAIGTATYRVDSLDRRQFNVYDVSQGSIDDPLYFEVDTPAVAITFVKEGVYRINVRDDGTTELIVRKGQAEVYNQELGTIPVKSGRRILIEGRDVGYYQIAKLNDKDEWDRWNDRRDDDFYARANNSNSSRYVPTSIAGSYDLDNYGDWIDTPEYGYVWSPRGVNANWAPYRSGYWRYHNVWGWTWTSYEPWGWAPYHYGRWTYWRSRWCWTPFINFSVGRVGVGFWNWSPHLVAFFGWGGGYNRGYRDGYWDGYRDASWTGWCPLGVGERWGGGYYGRGGRTIVNNTTIINNTTIVRSIDGLRNYHAPNGVGGMDGRRFDNRRVVVDNVTPPPRGAGGRGVIVDGNPGNGNRNQPTMEFARPETFRPTQGEVVRTLPVDRNSATARALSAPVVARRAPSGEGGRMMPTRNGGENGAMPVRDGNAQPVIRTVDNNQNNGQNNRPERTMPNRSSENSGVEIFNRPPRRMDGNNGNGDFRPVERVERPTATRPANEDRRAPMPERGGNSGYGGSNNSGNSERIFTPPRDRNMPRGDAGDSRGREMPQRQPERTETPRQPERMEMPRRESRPERIEMPSRAPERSAPRESAPSRAPERMERPAPPPRESRPERPSGDGSGRNMPTRKTDS